MDKTLRNTIIAGVVVITLCVVYFFVIKPEIEKKNYVECRRNFGTKEMVGSPVIQALIDSCVKSGGVEQYNKRQFVPLNDLPQELKK